MLVGEWNGGLRRRQSCGNVGRDALPRQTTPDNGDHRRACKVAQSCSFLQCPRLLDDAVFDEMRLSMQRGERIELRGFGVFQGKPRKRGIGRNPRTGKEVRIPPGRTIRFKPGKDLQNIS